MKPRSFLWQLFPVNLLLLFLSILAFAWYTLTSVGNHNRAVAEKQLESNARMGGELTSRYLLEGNREKASAGLRSMDRMTDTRFTIILADGEVFADSRARSAAMNNHGSRPEFLEAMQAGLGHSSRYSETLDQETLYCAVRMDGGGQKPWIMRAGKPLESVSAMIDSFLEGMLIAGAIMALAAALVSFWVARRLSVPLNRMTKASESFIRGDVDHLLDRGGSLEVVALSNAMTRMGRELKERFHTVTRQRNELEAILSSMAEAVLILGRDGDLLRINPAGARLFPSLAGEDQISAVAEPQLKPLLDLVQEILDGGSHLERTIVLYTREERHLQVNGTAIKTPGGQTLVLLVFHDVTRLRRLEMVRRDFVSNVSHELKTPITSIKGFVETLRDGAINDPANAGKFLDIIDQQTSRLSNIIEDLLQLSRLEQTTGAEEVDLEVREIGPSLEAVIQSCTPSARDKGIGIELTCQPDLRAHLNPHWLELAVANLVDNAIKYSSKGTRIELRAFEQDDQAWIQVKDQGIGIGPEHLPRIFERFYRVDRGRSRKMGGTGLGLAIVKHLVQALRGKLSVDSRVGEGSTFTIKLPLAR